MQRIIENKNKTRGAVEICISSYRRVTKLTLRTFNDKARDLRSVEQGLKKSFSLCAMFNDKHRPKKAIFLARIRLRDIYLNP